ncbi:hypothetical protein ACFVWP_12355 [Streptomyces sp. NPDC058175]|uniref:hypothetical protein n=1 Tax=Streptomyces sp. NPDC058175 TaxID=3346367 RepID=UPI0036E49D52
MGAARLVCRSVVPRPFGEPAEDHVEDADAPGEEGSAGPDPADVADVVRDVVGAGRGAPHRPARAPRCGRYAGRP